MDKLLTLALVALCGGASAQTPAPNPMPDGSRDMYLGLGAVSAPRHAGASERKLSVLPVLQVQFSNGIFISGMSAGMHLSSEPSLEFGPLLSVQPRRTSSGSATGVGGIEAANPVQGLLVRPTVFRGMPDGATPLTGMDDIHTRLQAGAFLNYYLTPGLRLTNSVLYGGGNKRDGALWSIGVQRVAREIAPHHTVALSAGLSIANRAYNQAFFGVSLEESARGFNPAYDAAGGLQDVTLGARWNWALSPSWMLSTGARVSRLVGSADNSPLAERPTNLTVSTALAYRF